MIALFSIDNEYNQPDNNLVALFKEKPSLPTLAKAIGVDFPSTNDNITLAVVTIWSNIDTTGGIRIGETDFRLETINFTDHN